MLDTNKEEIIEQNSASQAEVEEPILRTSEPKIKRWAFKIFIPGVLLGAVIGGVSVFGLFYSGIFKTSFFKNIIGSKTAGQNTSDFNNSELAAAQAFLKFKKIKEETIPLGVPDIYGQELNVSFDQAQDAIYKVAALDPTYGGQKIVLSGQNLKRYIDIGSLTACEYCCGAKTLVDEKGVAACGCEHSQMMRGLVAYLIEKHADMSDEEILQAANDWKAVFFPKQTLTAKLAELQKAGDTEIKTLLEEFPDFLPQMVGGC